MVAMIIDLASQERARFFVFKRITLVILFCLLIQSCALSRIVYQHPIDNKDYISHIIIFREYMFMGSALLTEATIDGIPTAYFYGNEFVKIPVTSGNHKVYTINAQNVSKAERELFEANKIYYFNATYERRTTTGVLPEVSEEEATQRMEKMEKIDYK
jgi:hypothetical protein